MKVFNQNGISALFLERLNRFLALIEIHGEETYAHIPNTGRMKELLVRGTEVLLEQHEKSNRKTKYTIKLVKYNERWVCIDSIITNSIAYEYLNGKKLGILRREVKFLSSRFDLSLSTEVREYFIEVKSVNLVKDGTAYFPDAPTTRGKKHLIELQKSIDMGFGAMVIFIVQRDDAKIFKPYREMDKEFTNELIKAHEKGLEIIVLKCCVEPENISVLHTIPYCLEA